MASRFDGFPKFELDLMWHALYHQREREFARGRTNADFEVKDLTHLIDELYRARNWREPVASHV